MTTIKDLIPLVNIEIIREYLQDIKKDVPDHQAKGTWADMHDNLDHAIALLDNVTNHLEEHHHETT